MTEIHVPPSDAADLMRALEHLRRLEELDEQAGLPPARSALHCLLGSAESVLRTLDAKQLRHLAAVLRQVLDREPVATRRGFESVYAFLDQLAFDVDLAIEPYRWAETLAHQDLDVVELPDIDFTSPNGSEHPTEA